MSMRDGESIKAYSDRYWEMFNKIDGDFDESPLKLSRLASYPSMV